MKNFLVQKENMEIFQGTIALIWVNEEENLAVRNAHENEKANKLNKFIKYI